MKVIKTLGIRVKKSSTSYNTKEKYSIGKEVYIDESRSTGRKLDYAAVFTDTTRRGLLPEEATIHTIEMTAMKEIKETEDIR